MARHGEGRRCGEDARRSECSRRCQGLRAMLTRQKGSAGGGCPHRVLERAERDAEGVRRRGRAETAGRRWWRGRKRAVPASWTHGLTLEGSAEADMGSGGPERHRRRAIARRRPHLRRRVSGAIPALQGSEQRKTGLGSFLASRRIFCGGSQGLGCSLVVDSRRRRAQRGGARRDGAELGSGGGCEARWGAGGPRRGPFKAGR